MNALQQDLLAWAKKTQIRVNGKDNMAIYGIISSDTPAWRFMHKTFCCVYAEWSGEEQVLALCFAIAIAGDE